MCCLWHFFVLTCAVLVGIYDSFFVYIHCHQLQQCFSYFFLAATNYQIFKHIDMWFSHISYFLWFFSILYHEYCHRHKTGNIWLIYFPHHISARGIDYRLINLHIFISTLIRLPYAFVCVKSLLKIDLKKTILAISVLVIPCCIIFLYFQSSLLSTFCSSFRTYKFLIFLA